MKQDKLPTHFKQILGKQPGPNIVILGGVHGDEKLGIKVIKELCDSFNISQDFSAPEKKIFNRNIVGNLFLGIGNPEAVKLNQRGVSSQDLNRCFVSDQLNEESQYDSVDHQRARELLPLLKQTDYLIDLHSTSSPSESFICFQENSKLHKRLYKHAPVNYILTDPTNPSVLSTPQEMPVLGTTDYFVSQFGGSGFLKKKYNYNGGVGLCYETGHFKDHSKLREVFKVVLTMLTKTDTIESTFLAEKDLNYNLEEYEQEEYKLVHCEQAESTNFSYKNNMNKGWIEVECGDVIGEYTDLDRQVTSSKDGLLLFPLNSEKIRYKGDGLFYIAKKV
jgi:hypothetical protein